VGWRLRISELTLAVLIAAVFLLAGALMIVATVIGTFSTAMPYGPAQNAEHFGSLPGKLSTEDRI
jgi:hypothetical protein